jgi:phenylalanyl-tRNA synthetase beta chain
MDEHALPDESYNLCIGCYGGDQDFFTLKGMIVALLNKLGITKLTFQAESEYGVYHPGRCARIQAKDQHGDTLELGIMGEVHPDVTENYDLEGRVYLAEMFFDLIVELADQEVIYKPLPKFPATSRDIAMIVEERMPVGQLLSAIRSVESDILEKVELFDVFRGIQIGEGRKSVAISVTYRGEDRTLTDDEVDEVHGEVLKMLRQQFGAVLRER